MPFAAEYTQRRAGWPRRRPVVALVALGTGALRRTKVGDRHECQRKCRTQSPNSLPRNALSFRRGLQTTRQKSGPSRLRKIFDGGRLDGRVAEVDREQITKRGAAKRSLKHCLLAFNRFWAHYRDLPDDYFEDLLTRTGKFAWLSDQPASTLADDLTTIGHQPRTPTEVRCASVRHYRALGN